MPEKPSFHQADARRFLDERGSSAALAPNGLNPATIMEKAVRERIVDSYFWMEQCFGVNEADIVDRVVDHVNHIGGTTGTAQKPTPFLCLALKLLQLAPDDDVVAAYLQQGGDKFKYLRALAVFYVRLTRPAAEVYRILEPYLADRRKLRRKGRAGTTLTYVDEFVDDLLTKPRVCATSLWKLPHREDLEDLGKLEPRESALGDIDALLEEEEDEEEQEEEAAAQRQVAEDEELERRAAAASDTDTDRSGSYSYGDYGRNGHSDSDSDDERVAAKRRRREDEGDGRRRRRDSRTPESDSDRSRSRSRDG